MTPIAGRIYLAMSHLEEWARIRRLKLALWLARNHELELGRRWSWARAEAILAGIKAENYHYWKKLMDNLQPGDPIPEPPPHLLKPDPFPDVAPVEDV